MNAISIKYRESGRWRYAIGMQNPDNPGVIKFCIKYSWMVACGSRPMRRMVYANGWR